MIDKGKRTKPGKNITKKKKPGRMGNPAVTTEYEDARENQMINRDKELAEELIRKPQSRNKMQPSRSMSIDTTTGISKMKEGGICRGAGAAIRGTKFQGVF